MIRRALLRPNDATTSKSSGNMRLNLNISQVNRRAGTCPRKTSGFVPVHRPRLPVVSATHPNRRTAKWKVNQLRRERMSRKNHKQPLQLLMTAVCWLTSAEAGHFMPATQRRGYVLQAMRSYMTSRQVPPAPEKEACSYGSCRTMAKNSYASLALCFSR